MKKCPFCAEEIQNEAIVCRYCKRDLFRAPSNSPNIASVEKSKSPILAILLVIIIIFLLFVWLKSRDSSTNTNRELPSYSPISTTHIIQYSVDGSTYQADITWENETGSTAQDTIKVPWSKKFIVESGYFAYISAQNQSEYGDVSCEIKLDGIVVKEATSSSDYGIASCSGRVP